MLSGTFLFLKSHGFDLDMVTEVMVRKSGSSLCESQESPLLLQRQTQQRDMLTIILVFSTILEHTTYMSRGGIYT
jgi:hypothetical protein